MKKKQIRPENFLRERLKEFNDLEILSLICEFLLDKCEDIQQDSVEDSEQLIMSVVKIIDEIRFCDESKYDIKSMIYKSMMKKARESYDKK